MTRRSSPRAVSRIAWLVLQTFMLVPGYLLMAQDASKNCLAQHYKVIALPLQPAHINQARHVVGTTSSHRAALWTEQSGLREVPLPPGYFNSEGIAVNRSGHLTGVAYDRTFSKHQAFLFANGAMTLLAGEQSRSYAINDSDEVVGESLLPGKKATEPVFWGKNSSAKNSWGRNSSGKNSLSKNTIQSLGGCCGGSARAVNNHAVAIGDLYDQDGRYHAFTWNSRQGLQTIGPPDRYSSAIAINNRGDILIQVLSDVFLYAGGKLIALELSTQAPSQPLAINNCDVIVGSYGPFSDVARAFVWQKSSGFRDLNTLIAPNSGWKLESATSINDRGEIVGRGDYQGNEDAGFLLIPDR